jgi:ATP-binding cassette subfamily B protein RaxB
LKKATEERIIHEAKLSTNIIESVRGMRSISLFSKQSDRHSLTANHLVDLINAGVNVDKIKLNYSTMNSLIFGMERILVFFFGAQLVLQGAFTVGVLIAFNIYREKFDLRISSLIDKYFDFRMLRVQADRLADIVLHEKEPNIDLHQDTSELAPSIKLSNVSFAYAEGEQKVLENISFEVNAGESVAIVGPSGAGKSTLINLLLGIINPQSGTICIGNTPLNKIGFNNLRKVVGTVMQDDTLFSGSISDNICFFDHSKEFDRIIECAKMAHIHDEIIAMPMGYDTLIGDMGTALSGGQKQRLLIARALYKEPKILVLDEATSHLDVELERKVNDSIRQLSVTRIIVAHRPETIQSADRIIDIREVSNIPKEANPNYLLPQLHHEMRPVT